MPKNNKKKQQLKTFKFEISATEINYACDSPKLIDDEHYVYSPNPRFTINGYATLNYEAIKFENLLAPNWIQLGKIYTIEIKEK